MLGEQRPRRPDARSARSSTAWREWIDARGREVVDDVDAALQRTDTMAVLLDRNGRIVAHNDAWLAAAEDRHDDLESVGIGADYLAVCTNCRHAQGGAGPRAAAGVREVLEGRRHQFVLDYETLTPDHRQWFTLRASQLAGPGSGVLVTHVDITSVRETEHAIRGRVHRLWKVVDPGTDFVLLLDAAGNVLGRTWDQSRSVQWPVPGEAALDFVHPADLDNVVARIAEIAEVAGRRAETVVRAQHPGDPEGWRHFSATGINMLDDPEVQGIVVAVTDLTDRLRSSTAQTLSTGLMDELPISALATDDVGIVIGLNASAAELLRVPIGQVLGHPLGDYVSAMSPDVLSEARDVAMREEFWAGEVDIRRADDSVVPVWLRVQRLDGDTGFEGLSYLAVDRSELRRLQDSLTHRDAHDVLTGLPNREAFLRRVGELVDECDPAAPGLVALVSLDRFRDVNAVHGSDVGDHTLRRAGSALRAAAGPTGFVARLYGDLFGVAVGADRATPSFGDQLRLAVEVVEPTPGVALPLTASVGLRIVAGGDVKPQTIIDEALAAASEVKSAGGNGARRFDERLRHVLEERMALRLELPRAVVAGQLTVEYQPIVRLDDGFVVGAEALVRWDHPERGRIAPDQFIPLAERSGVIHDIGAHVLDDACRHAARWRQVRPEIPLSVAVNVSTSQLSDPRLDERVRAAIERHHLDPSSITLELTESMLMDDSGFGLQQMARLKATGARIAVDDFGTGYSSLSRLKELPLDVVKIDRSFVREVASSPEDASIVRTVVSLASAFGVDVVAEGVETLDQGSALRAVGCTTGQGFLWSPAVDAESFEELLRQPFPCAPTPETGAEVEDRFHAFSDALRTIQHELATPLAVLNTTVAMHDESGGIPRELHGTVKRSVHRVSRLVESLDLLDRLDRGTLRLRRLEVDVALLVRRSVEEISSHAARPIHVHGPDRLHAMIDGSLVEQVITNLLTNAVKYSPHAEPVSVGVSQDCGLVRVEVHDRGSGIPPEQVGTIWRKFGRLDHSVPGSGIGLYLARGIARAHGGDLRYRAGDPAGSVFVLDLPSDTSDPG